MCFCVVGTSACSLATFSGLPYSSNVMSDATQEKNLPIYKHCLQQGVISIGDNGARVSFLLVHVNEDDFNASSADHSATTNLTVLGNSHTHTQHTHTHTHARTHARTSHARTSHAHTHTHTTQLFVFPSLAIIILDVFHAVGPPDYPQHLNIVVSCTTVFITWSPSDTVSYYIINIQCGRTNVALNKTVNSTSYQFTYQHNIHSRHCEVSVVAVNGAGHSKIKNMTAVLVKGMQYCITLVF